MKEGSDGPNRFGLRLLLTYLLNGSAQSILLAQDAVHWTAQPSQVVDLLFEVLHDEQVQYPEACAPPGVGWLTS